jgi:hypothetical protein
LECLLTGAAPTAAPAIILQHLGAEARAVPPWAPPSGVFRTAIALLLRQRSPRKDRIATTITTAPTSQTMLFMVPLLAGFFSTTGERVESSLTRRLNH